MLKLKEKFIVDEKGEKREVILSISDYKMLLQRLEDIEDALELKKAVEEDREFEDFDSFTKKLKAEGKL